MKINLMTPKYCLWFPDSLQSRLFLTHCIGIQRPHPSGSPHRFAHFLDRKKTFFLSILGPFSISRAVTFSDFFVVFFPIPLPRAPGTYFGAAEGTQGVILVWIWARILSPAKEELRKKILQRPCTKSCRHPGLPHPHAQTLRVRRSRASVLNNNDDDDDHNNDKILSFSQ